MSNEKWLRSELDTVNEQMKANQREADRLRNEWSRLNTAIAETVRSRGPTIEDLRFAATARCSCGAGLAYLKDDMDPRGAWRCSVLLMLPADERGPDDLHDEPKPFVFWKIKSEDQPSANGATTRPSNVAGNSSSE